MVIRRQVVGVILCVCVCELELVQSSSGISPPVRARGARALKCGRAGLKNNLTIKTSCPAQLGMAPPLVVSIARAPRRVRVGLRAAAPALTLAAAIPFALAFALVVAFAFAGGALALAFAAAVWIAP